MYGSGVKTGMEVTTIPVRLSIILQDRLRALTACYVGVAGTPLPRSAVLRTGTTARLLLRTTTAACASPFSSSSKNK